MHLNQKLVHVWTGSGWKDDEIKDDSLHLRFHESKLMLKKLKQNVVLMQIGRGLEILKIRIDEISEE